MREGRKHHRKGLYEIDRVGGKPLGAFGRIGRKGVGDLRKAVTWKGMGDD